MFKNVEELRELIRQGKTNEEIIKGQLEYLNSKDYLDNRMETINEYVFNQKTDRIVFHDGYIPPYMQVTNKGGGPAGDIEYIHDDTEIYDIIINLIRDNLDKKGFALKIMIDIINDYFKYDENSKYKELIEFLKEQNPDNPNYAREELPRIIHEYKYIKNDWSITDFGKAHYYYFLYRKNEDERYKKIHDEYLLSYDSDAAEGDYITSLSELKGLGLAKCTEKAMLAQNILSFLGYNTYMIGGTIVKENGKAEAHNFNVVEKKENEYTLADAAQHIVSKLDGINSPYDLLNLDYLMVTNPLGEKRFYCTNGEQVELKL